MKVCPVCGAAVDDAAEYCDNCGNDEFYEQPQQFQQYDDYNDQYNNGYAQPQYPQNDYNYQQPQYNQPAYQQPVEPQPAFGPTYEADMLKSYKELLDSGIITQEEFDQKKKQVLGL